LGERTGDNENAYREAVIPPEEEIEKYEEIFGKVGKKIDVLKKRKEKEELTAKKNRISREIEKMEFLQNNLERIRDDFILLSSIDEEDEQKKESR
jgi:molecular chaperone GrpE (heat shock protein)